jgi:hypothetical protein
MFGAARTTHRYPLQNLAVSDNTPQARTLRRALAICGDIAALARALGVSVGELARWLDGHAAPPVNIYIMALDLVADGRAKGSATSD